MQEEQDINKSIDDFLSKPQPSDSESAVKIGVAVFIAILSAFVVNEVYEEYKMRQLAKTILKSTQSFTYNLDRINARNQKRLRAASLENQRKVREIKAENEIRVRKLKRKQHLDNYWKDIGSGTFINVGRSKRSGDLATALIKVNNRQLRVNVNCNNNTYWSVQNNGWFPALDSFTAEYKMIKTACSSIN